MELAFDEPIIGVGSLEGFLNNLAMMTKRKGDRGSTCLIPLEGPYG